MIRLATVSPCYNEEAVLHHSVEQLTVLFERMIAEGHINKDSMMVFVNDGSRDRTWEIIRELHANRMYEVSTCRATWGTRMPLWQV